MFENERKRLNPAQHPVYRNKWRREYLLRIAWIRIVCQVCDSIVWSYMLSGISGICDSHQELVQIKLLIKKDKRTCVCVCVDCYCKWAQANVTKWVPLAHLKSDDTDQSPSAITAGSQLVAIIANCVSMYAQFPTTIMDPFHGCRLNLVLDSTFLSIEVSFDRNVQLCSRFSVKLGLFSVCVKTSHLYLVFTQCRIRLITTSWMTFPRKPTSELRWSV